MASFNYMTQGDPPWGLFRFALDDAQAWYLAPNGEWVENSELLRYRQDDPLGADDVTAEEARQVAVLMGEPADIVT